MKLGLKDKIQAQIDAYHVFSTVKMVESRQVFQPFETPSYADQFTQKALRQIIKEKTDLIHAEWKKYNKTLNDLVKSEVEEARKTLMNSLHLKEGKKTSDYSIRVANAREFLRNELDAKHETVKELDSALFMILKDFVDDYDTMKLFSRMVEKKQMLIDASGKCSLPKTFGRMMKASSIMNTLNEVEELAAMLFLYEIDLSRQEVIRIKGDSYAIPVSGYYNGEFDGNDNQIAIDGYAQMADEQAIINNATILDDLADKIDEDGHFTFSGEGQKIDL